MNQILSINNNYGGYNKNETKKIITIFGIIVIILAIAIIALVATRIYKNKQNMSKYSKPEILINKENDNQIILKVSCDDGINYIVYTWNYETENRVNLNGSTTFERIIDIPYNEINTLEVVAVSINKIQSETSQEITMEGIDLEKPTIDALTVAGSKLNIETSDNSGIANIKYQWEGKEEETIYPEEENEKNVKAQIEIERGTHKLTIKVTDIYGNEELLSRLVTGVNEPEINVIKYSDKINITITHDMGIKEVGVLINDKLYRYNEESPQYSNDTTITLEYPLEEGENLIKIVAYSLEKLSMDEDNSLNNYSYKTYVGKCVYEEEQQ